MRERVGECASLSHTHKNLTHHTYTQITHTDINLTHHTYTQITHTDIIHTHTTFDVRWRVVSGVRV